MEDMCYEDTRAGERCCLLVLDSVTSTPQCICQPRPRVYLKEGTYHTRLFRAIMATPYTGLFVAASCNSRSSHGQVHPLVVISGAFINFLLHNHSINIK